MSDHTYIPAKWQWPRKAGSVVRLIVVHSMESPEKGDTAESCAHYFQNGSGGRVASAHRLYDNNSIVEAVHLDRKAAGAAGGLPYHKINDEAIHLEHAGYARQTPADWADDYSVKMLFWSAIDAAQISKQYGIHSVFRTVDDLKAGRWNGYTDHRTIEAAFPSTGHSDPGPNFPWQSYLAAVSYWIARP